MVISWRQQNNLNNKQKQVFYSNSSYFWSTVLLRLNAPSPLFFKIFKINGSLY